MKNVTRLTLLFSATLVISGCGYGYYLGLHGPSIRGLADIHQGYTQDSECLDCHGPDAAGEDAPATSHPTFKGCIDCHDD